MPEDRVRPFFPLATAGVLLAAGVHAQTLPQAGATLAPVVVTATAVPTPIADIPAGVTIITRAALERHGDNTLTDALAAVPGRRVSASGGPGGNASVFIRGT
ncbi:MAG: TonB-dependent receptor, partial [Rhodospirillales bacterium]|nr:TonB-dependent receptor [Rhodospirillales bacterium]